MTTSAEILTLAEQYHATGNWALAEQYAASIVEEEPNHSGALYLLGIIAHQNGNPREALAFLNRALTADGSNAAAWHRAGDILLASGSVPGSITYYQQVVRLRPDFAEGHNALGIALQYAGSRVEAVACFQRATRLAPTLVPALNNLGTALRSLGRLAEAGAAFADALKQWPDNADIAFNLGNVLFDQGDLPGAIACYRRALRLQPGYAADVSNSLAVTLKKQGLWREAVDQYQETLRLRPGHAMALFNLSEMAGAGQYDFPPEELTRAKNALASGHIAESERILCAFAVANVLHLQGAFDEAFRYYREANELQLQLFKKRNTAFDARAFEARIDRIIADHGAAFFERVKDWGLAAELPVFVVGMPYAGTAEVEEMLAAHPHVSRRGSAYSVVRFLAEAAPNNNAVGSAAQLFPNLYAVRSAGTAYLQRLTHLGQGASRVLVNAFENVMSLGLIATLFPGARVIYCRREPFDIALTCYFQNRRDLSFAFSLEDLAAYSSAYEKLMAHWTQVLPLTIHEVAFEDLVNHREKTARALVAFIGLDWDERCAADASAVKTSYPPAAAMVGLAEHYRAHLGPLVKAPEK